MSTGGENTELPARLLAGSFQSSKGSSATAQKGHLYTNLVCDHGYEVTLGPIRDRRLPRHFAALRTPAARRPDPVGLDTAPCDPPRESAPGKKEEKPPRSLRLAYPSRLSSACLVRLPRKDSLKERQPPLPSFLLQQCPLCSYTASATLRLDFFSSDHCPSLAASSGGSHGGHRAHGM